MSYQIFIRLAGDIWDAETEIYATRVDAEQSMKQMFESFKAVGITDVPKSDYKVRISK